MTMPDLKTPRLVLSGGLLGIAVANVLFGTGDSAVGEWLAGAVGAGVAFVAIKALAIA